MKREKILKTEKYGILYIVATPIGNLSDLSIRVIETLKNVDLIAAEDTRVTKKILFHIKSHVKSISCHKFNERSVCEKLINHLLSGESIALVSDAGTPCISDPGFILVNLAHQNNIKVISIPGPSSVIAACSLSGFDCKNFIFKGFLPKKEGELLSLIDSLSEVLVPVVFFESPNRILKTLIILKKILDPDVNISLSKEISKKFETTLTGTLETIIKKLTEIETVKGEWVGIIDKIVLKNIAKKEGERTLKEISEYFNVNRNKAAKILAIATGKSKKDIYSGKE